MNVPKLRFKEFNDEYKKLKYGNCLKIKSGRNQKQVDCENGNYPILGTGGIIGTTNSYLYNKPSVLIGRKGTINKPQYMETPFWTVDTLFYSKIFDCYFPKYLYFSFQNVNWKKYDESTGVPSLSCSTIEKVDCYIPSKNEQIKVSNFLSLLNKKIELQSEKIEDLKLFKKGLFDKLFKDIDGDNYLLSDIAKFENGKGHENIIDDNGKYILINSKFISTEGNIIKKCSEQLTPLFKDDITIVMSDLPNGKALAKCYYIEEDNKYSLNQRICKIHIKDNKFINSKYLFYLLNRNPYFLKFDDGVNQTNLKKDDILNINLIIPTIEVQEKNSKLLTTIDNLINKESAKLSKLEVLKKGLMQNMFV